MERDEIRGVLLKIFATVSEKLAQRKDINDETLLRQGLGLDSLQMLEMVFEIEEKLGVTVEENDAKGLKTVGDLASFIEARQKSRPAQRSAAERGG